VTSLERLGISVTAQQWDDALLARAGQFLAKLEQACPVEAAPTKPEGEQA
jgi:lipoyl(octanoyl) transferase